MKITIPILTILALMAAFLFQSRQNLINKTRADLQEASNEIQKLKKLQHEMQANPATPPDEDQLKAFRENRKDLIKLRGEHTRLSSTKDWSLTDLEEEIEKVENRATTLKREGKLIQDMDEAEKQMWRIRGQLSSFVHVVHFLHKRGQKPQTLREVKEMVDSLPDSLKEKQWFTGSFEVVDIWHPISWKDCELVIVDASDSSATSTRYYITEKKHRNLPNGSLSRLYSACQPYGFKEIRAWPQDFEQNESDFLKNLPESLFNSSSQ